MTTLLEKQRSAASNLLSPDDATLDQVLSRIAMLAPMVARLAPDIEQGRRLPTELVSALRSARIYGMLVPRRYGGAAKGLARVAEQLQAAIWITSASVRVAEGCFELAGSRAVYESASLQRRVRDLRVAAQHVAVHPRNYVTAGAPVLARLS